MSYVFTGLDMATRLVAAVGEAMDVWSVRRPAGPLQGIAPGHSAGAVEILGKLRLPSDRAYDLVSKRFESLGYTAFFRRSADGDLVLARPGVLSAGEGRPWVAIALFVATFASVLLVGALAEQGPDQSFNILDGWPFALSLLGILMSHEMGHYLVARRVGMPASLPYFIPLPLSIFGTMGAVMQMKAPPRNRRALLAVGAAGPLAGLAVALPILILGLTLSEVQPVPTDIPILQEGNSLLYAGLKILIFGRFLPAGGEDVFLHPVALAGWAGLLVTALNLIPAGQLDGGHVLYALLGQRAGKVTWGIIVALVGLSFLWPGWLLWAGLVFMFGRVHAVPLDDITAMRRREYILCIFLLILAVLVFVPVPMVAQFP